MIKVVTSETNIWQKHKIDISLIGDLLTDERDSTMPQEMMTTKISNSELSKQIDVNNNWNCGRCIHIT